MVEPILLKSNEINNGRTFCHYWDWNFHDSRMIESILPYLRSRFAILKNGRTHIITGFNSWGPVMDGLIGNRRDAMSLLLRNTLNFWPWKLIQLIINVEEYTQMSAPSDLNGARTRQENILDTFHTYSIISNIRIFGSQR